MSRPQSKVPGESRLRQTIAGFAEQEAVTKEVKEFPENAQSVGAQARAMPFLACQVSLSTDISIRQPVSLIRCSTEPVFTGLFVQEGNYTS